MTRYIMIFALVVLFLVPSVMADRRKYVWTYQFATVAPEATELEFYQTTKIDDSDSWEYRIEIEHGITDRWDFSMYQIFAQNEGETFKWDAFQLRTRYKLAEAGQFFVDPLLYLEYNRKTDLKKQNKFEVKLILARDFDRVNLAVNPVVEYFWAPGDPVHEIGLDFGLSYQATYKFVIGVESTSRIEYLDHEPNEESSYLGPTISYASGELFYTVGYAWGLTDDSNDAQVRFILGVGL